MLHRRLHAEKDATEIHTDHAVKRGHVVLTDRHARPLNTRVVHHDVHAAVAVERAAEQQAHVVIEGDVGAHVYRRTARGNDSVHQGLAMRRVEIRDNNACAFRRKADGNCAANAVRRAGDNRHLIVQETHDGLR